MVLTLFVNLLLLVITSNSPTRTHATFVPTNATVISFSSTPDESHHPLPASISSPPFLADIVKEIASLEKWDPSGEIRVFQIESTGIRVGELRRYEFEVRVGKAKLLLRFYDDGEEIVAWRRWNKWESGEEFGPDLVEDLGAKVVIRDLELEGPIELLVDGGGDEFSLFLPAMNITHRGLRRVLIGDGITVKVEGAKEVSLLHPYNIGQLLSGSSVSSDADPYRFLPLGFSSCMPVLSMCVVGSASLVSFRTLNPEVFIGTAFHAHDHIELLPDKCFGNGNFKCTPICSIPSISSKMVLLKEFLSSYLGNEVLQNKTARFLKAKITTLALVKFRFELERVVTKSDRVWKKVEDWRTKPTIERVWFEILARVEGGRGLKPVTIKKLKRPLVSVDSTAWSNLMSNLSFTQFPSIVVPPEALTLDVKW